MYLARQLTSDSYAEHRARASAARTTPPCSTRCNKIDSLLQQDPKFRRTLDHIINTIRLA